jgi:hypothetical protein
MINLIKALVESVGAMFTNIYEIITYSIEDEMGLEGNNIEDYDDF